LPLSPSLSDAQAAVTKGITQSVQSSGELGQMFGKYEVHSLKKIGCKEAAESTGYFCDYELDVTVPVFGRRKGPANALFVKAKEGWVVMEKN
jgi:hypothetical protein